MSGKEEKYLKSKGYKAQSNYYFKKKKEREELSQENKALKKEITELKHVIRILRGSLYRGEFQLDGWKVVDTTKKK
jgi:hypothetical protein